MKKITLLLAMLAFSFGFSQDTCGTAVVITPGAFTATQPTDATGGSEMGAVGTYDSAWFSYTPAGDGLMTISACLGGSDTRLYVGTGTCGALTVVASNDDSCPFATDGTGNAYASELTDVVVTGGTTYYIEWDDRWENVAFDWSLSFVAAPECGDPTGLGSANLTETTADLSWTAPAFGTPTNYNWEVQPSGMPQGTAGAPASGVEATTAVTAMGLMAGTPYDFYVQTNCGGTLSAYAGPVSFTTTFPPPTNDECATAIAMVCGETVSGSTVLATDSGSNAAFDVFYSFTDTILQDVTLSLCNSGYDTYVRVFDDCPQTNEIAGNDDSAACAAGTRSEVTFTAQPNTTYYIMVEGFGGNEGNYEMTATCIPNVPAPANDLCSAATAITLPGALSGETTAGATDSSTGGTDDTSCQGFTFKSDVWYTFVAPLTGQVDIATTTSGTSDAASFAVYSSTDCSQLDVDSIACVVGDATGASGNVAGLTAGNIYSIRVWSDGVAARSSGDERVTASRIEGTFDISVTESTLSTPGFDANTLFSYYPNPVKSSLTLNAQKEIANVTVFNMLGQTVLRVAPNAISSDVDMSNFQAGAYFVQVTVGDAVETVKVIKK